MKTFEKNVYLKFVITISLMLLVSFILLYGSNGEFRDNIRNYFKGSNEITNTEIKKPKESKTKTVERPRLKFQKKSDVGEMSKYTLDISTVLTKEAANRSLKRLARKGVQAYYTPIEKDGKVIYKIRTGIYYSEELAKEMSEKLLISNQIKVKPVNLNQ